MTFLRAAVRLVLLVFLTVASACAVMMGRLAVFLPRSVRRRWIRWAYRSWGRAMGATLGMRLRVEGTPPEAPFLLVTNHLSYVDIFLLSGLTGGVFIAKSEIRDWPLVGWVCRTVRTIFVDRGNRRDVVRVGREIADRMATGEGIVLFAEGTTSCGETVAPFKPSLLAPAVQLEVEVHHAALSYRTDEDSKPARDAVCWWGDEELIPHVRRLCRLPGFYATVRFGQEPIRCQDRKVLAEDLRQAILQSFISVTSPEDACTT